MAITKQRIKKIEQDLDIGKPKEVQFIIVGKTGADVDKEAEKKFIDDKKEEARKSKDFGLLPYEIIVVDYEAIKKAQERIKVKNQTEL